MLHSRMRLAAFVAAEVAAYLERVPVRARDARALLPAGSPRLHTPRHVYVTAVWAKRFEHTQLALALELRYRREAGGLALAEALMLNLEADGVCLRLHDSMARKEAAEAAAGCCTPDEAAREVYADVAARPEQLARYLARLRAAPRYHARWCAAYRRAAAQLRAVR